MAESWRATVGCAPGRSEDRRAGQVQHTALLRRAAVKSKAKCEVECEPRLATPARSRYRLTAREREGALLSEGAPSWRNYGLERHSPLSGHSDLPGNAAKRTRLTTGVFLNRFLLWGPANRYPGPCSYGGLPTLQGHLEFEPTALSEIQCCQEV